MRSGHRLADTNGLSSDFLPNPFAETGRRAHVDFTAEKVLQVELEPLQFEVSCGTVEFDQQIHVALVRGFVPRDGAEDRQRPHAELLLQLRQLIAKNVQRLVTRHGRYSLAQLLHADGTEAACIFSTAADHSGLASMAHGPANTGTDHQIGPVGLEPTTKGL
jgi:hypothetical protein